MQFPAFGFRIDHKGFAYETGIGFEGMSVTEHGDGYVITLRGRRPNGEAVYCSWIAADLELGFDGLYRAITGKQAADLWHKDKFRK